MHDFSDMELVRDYVRLNSEAAFAELVQRHINLVYSVAMRHVCVAAQAEEVTQAVFIILARKTASLRPDTILDGWLYETTRLASLSVMRGERRRQFREQEAYMQSTLAKSPDDPIWPQLSPLLDEAMSHLGKKDRDVMLLRYFKGKNVREVAEALQINESAAQQRILRTLEKLRNYFAKRGVSSTTEIIAGEISVNSVQAAPVALVKTISVVAFAKGAAASASTLTLINGALKIMAWTKAKTAVVVSACVLLTAGTVIICNREKPIQGIPPGWSVLNGSAQWGSAKGKIVADSINGDSILASSDEYGDVTFSAVVSSTNREASLVFRLQDENNGYLVVFAPTGRPAPSGPDPGYIALIKRFAGNETTLASYKKRNVPVIGSPAKIRVVARGSALEIFLNGVSILKARDTTFASGYIGFRIYGWADYPCDATFSDVTFH